MLDSEQDPGPAPVRDNYAIAPLVAKPALGRHNQCRGQTMAIVCPRCGTAYDVTLFQFGRSIWCECGCRVDLAGGHTLAYPTGREGGATMAEQEIGRVTHYFGHINVAAIEITKQALSVGDTIHIKGHTSDFTQHVDSMQLDGKNVQRATVGQSVGIKVAEHAREHDTVYKVTPE